ncbi:MAG: aldose 1-epimerase [Rhizobacter sp.]
MNTKHPIVWLEHSQQRLGLVPTLGGGVAAWQTERPKGRLDLWRPWDGVTEDRYKLASFAMLPWSNRISGGGFEQAGHFHPMALNRAGEPYPIHGDGWLQAWSIDQTAADTVVMCLESHRFDGNPYDYQATQTFTLSAEGLDQSVSVTHLGDKPLPYGMGLHPWFPRGEGTRVTAPVRGLWLCGDDPLPTEHTERFPPTWDLNLGAPATGPLIDNGFTGWSGDAYIDWPEHGLRMAVRVPAVQRSGRSDGFCLVYRPPQGPAFCFEPITHPIDAFHMPGKPGLRVLARGESMSLDVHWRVQELAR